MGIIDTIILLLFLVIIIIGFFRGFIKQVLASLAWIIALIAAVCLCSTAAEALMDMKVGISLNNSIYEFIASKGESFTTVVSTINEEDLSSVLTQIGIPNILHSFIVKNIDLSTFMNTSIAEFISPKISLVLLIIIAFIVIYLFVFIIIKVIAKLFGNIVRGSALGFVDGVLGAIWGSVKICILISVLMLALSFVVSMPFGDPINEWITIDMKLNEEGFGIAKFFYENNLILFVISKIPFNK